MSIYVTPNADLLAMLGTASSLALLSSDLRYGKPHPTTDAEKAVHNRNTRLAVAFDSASSKGIGHRDVFYDRLNVASLANADFTTLALTPSVTLSAMIGYLRKYTGAVFTTDDLVEHTATYDEASGNVSYLIEAKASSLGWMGSFTLTATGVVDISTAFNDDKLDGFK